MNKKLNYGLFFVVLSLPVSLFSLCLDLICFINALVKRSATLFVCLMGESSFLLFSLIFFLSPLPLSLRLWGIVGCVVTVWTSLCLRRIFPSLAERSDLTEFHLRVEEFSISHHHSLSPPVFVLVALQTMILLLSSCSFTAQET